MEPFFANRPNPQGEGNSNTNANMQNHNQHFQPMPRGQATSGADINNTHTLRDLQRK